MVDFEKLVFDLIFSDDINKKYELFYKIFNEAQVKGIYLASVNDLYFIRGRGKCNGFTVPAINLRCLTYDLARAIFRVAKRNNSATFIFEIAKSEMGYTDQRPCEYTGVVLAAALKEGYKGAIFIQGDHFQINAKKFQENAFKEMEGIKDLINEAVSAGFFNIDIDSSTLVDLTKPSVIEEQENNFCACAELLQYIREIQPKGVVISVGGEIGEVGGKNSNPEELEAFMEGLNLKLKEYKIKEGISKISVQTGTSHGGVVLPDGSIAKVKLDFETLKNLSKLAREKYNLSGAVQHGASTLPAEAFHKFVECETAEVHLATEFQNMVYESKHFPLDLKNRIYEWLKVNAASEKKEGETEEQFFYKTRKKALGPFKKEIMELSQDIRDKIAVELEEKFNFLFKQLNVVNTEELVEKYIKPVKISFFKKNMMSKATDSEGAD